MKLNCLKISKELGNTKRLILNSNENFAAGGTKNVPYNSSICWNISDKINSIEYQPLKIIVSSQN